MTSGGSGEELLDDYVRTMGQKLGQAFYFLSDDLTWLHMRWALFRQLFAKSPQRIDLLNVS